MIVRFEKKSEKTWLAVAVVATVVASACLGAAVVRFASSNDNGEAVCAGGLCTVGGEE